MFIGMDTIYDTTTVVVIVPPPPDTTIVVIPPGGTDTVCIDDLLQLGGGADTAFFCSDTMSNALTGEGLVNSDSCVVITAPDDMFGPVDSLCIVHCYTIGTDTLYDTTTVIVTVLPPPDTIPVIIPPGDSTTICLDSLLQLGGGADTAYFCEDTATTQSTEMLVMGDSCVTITAPDHMYGAVDSICIVHCYVIGMDTLYDTTTVVVIVPPPPDTTIVVIPPGGTDTVCIDDLLQLGGGADTAFFCSDTMSNALTGEGLVNSDSCVVITAPTDMFGPVDSLCIVHCYTIGTDTLYDTTTVIVTVLPPPDTIPVIIPPGDSTTICLDSLLQLGGGADTAYFCEDTATTQSTEMLVMGDSCVTITAPDDMYGAVDSICIVHCYVIGMDTIYDTTTVVVIVPPPPDTTLVVIPPGGTDTVCIDDLLQLGGGADTAFFCSDTMSNALTGEGLVNSDSCVVITAPTDMFGPVDSLCIVHCYTIGTDTLYDTTTVIVTVLPPPDTIPVIIPPGDSTTICLDSLLQLGGGADTAYFCEDTATTQSTEMLVMGDSCVTITAPDDMYGAVDSICIVHCYVIGMDTIYDTTTVVVICTTSAGVRR